MSMPISSQPSSAGKRQPIQLDPSERLLFVGKTGSGKSFLAKALLRKMAAKGWRIVIIDPKAFWLGKSGKWATKGNGTVDSPRLVERFDSKLQVMCYQPSTPAIDDEQLNELCEAILNQGNTIVYFDELDGVATASKMSFGFSRLWTMGRALNVGAWAATQRPARIPEIVKSQAEHWMVFRVVGPDDRKVISAYIGSPQIAEHALNGHQWWYYHPRLDTAALMAPYKESSDHGKK